MSWLQVGKSFQEANATSLTIVGDTDGNVETRPSKRLREEKHVDEFDSSSSSDDEPVGPMLELRAQPRMAKSVLELTWSVDRRGDRSSFHFSAKRDEKEKGYNSNDSVSSQKSGSRSKKRRKIYLETRSNQLPCEDSREIFDKRWRYFGKHGRNTLLSLSSHRLKLRNRSQAGEKVADSPQAFLVAPQTEHLVPILDMKENPDLFQIGVDPKCVTSLQMEIMDEIRLWASLFAEMRSLSQTSESTFQWPLVSDALHSLQAIVHSLHHIASGEFSTLSPPYIGIGSKVRLNQFDRALTEKMVELLKQRWAHYQTLEGERIIAGDSLLSDITMSLMHQEIHLHSAHEFDLRLQTLLQELPWSWSLHDLRRRCLRNSYSSSSFKSIRDFETQFWSNLQAVIKNRSAARKLLHDLTAAPLTHEDPEEELLRSVDVQRKRIEHVAYFDRLLHGMGYEEHVVGHFQALMMIHLKEIEVPGAAFVVREILQNWEGEIDLRLGEVSSGMHIPSMDPWFSSSNDYVSLMRLKTFPSQSLVLPMTVSYGPAPPEPAVEEPPAPAPLQLASSNGSHVKENEVVDGKVLVYSRVHGYKIWIPANAAAEDTTEIYRRVLSTVERDIDLPTMQEPTKTTQPLASARDSMHKLPPVQRLVYPDAERSSDASLSYQPFLLRDLIRSKLEYLPLRALGLSFTTEGNDADEAAAMRAMEEAEKFPERVVFSEDLKPLMFWIRDAPTAASSSTWPSTMVSPDLSSGIFALPTLLIQLGPTALGLHMVSSMQYTTVEEELLALEPSMMEPTLPTFSILHHLLSITDDVPQQQQHLWHGFLRHMDHQRSIRNPGFISHEVLSSHRLKGILRSRTGTAAACSLPTSRLEFAIQVIDQLIHRLVAFIRLPTTNQYSTSSRKWLATMVTQLRRWLLHLFFTQCRIDCAVLVEEQQSSSSSSSSSPFASSSVQQEQQMMLIEGCRQRCRAVLESTVDDTTAVSCPAGDLTLWAFYLNIEQRLLDMQTPEVDVSVRYLPLWKMADKLIRAIDTTSSPSRMMAHSQERFPAGEMTLYATIAMILVHVAVKHPTVQSLYVATARDFLVQRAWCRWNREQTTNATTIASVLKALQVSPDTAGKASKKKANNKAEVFVSNPMMEQEAIVLWQQASQTSLKEWLEQPPAASVKPTLHDEPELVDVLRCTSLLELLLMLRTQGGAQNSTTAYYCCGDSAATLSRAITEVIASWKPSTTKRTVEDHRRELLVRALHLDRAEQTTLFALLTSPNTTVDATVPLLEQQQQQRHEYPLMDLLCARTLEILTVIPQDALVLGSGLYWQYIGQGKGCLHPNGVHNGYRAMRQYWRDVHATRSLGPYVQERDPHASMAFLRTVGYHGNKLSLRERAFELGLELLRHRHVLHQTLTALHTTNSTETRRTSASSSTSSSPSSAVLPDWRTFFTDVIPHYRLMYETSSHDAEIQRQPVVRLAVPAVIESLQRVGTILEQVVSWPCSSDVPWVWRLYSHLYLSVGDVETAKKVGLRALAKCGWCKAMYVDMLGAFSARPAAAAEEEEKEEEKEDTKKRDEELAAIARMMQSQGIFLRA